MSNKLISLELFFHDEDAVRLAGVDIPESGKVQSLPGAIPATGDVLRFSGMNYQSGELAIFRVVSRAHLFGGEHIQRIQLNLELVVLHQP